MRGAVLAQVDGAGHAQAGNVDHGQRATLAAVVGDHGKRAVGREHDLVGIGARGQRRQRPPRRDIDNRRGRGGLVGHDDRAGQPGHLRVRRGRRCHSQRQARHHEGSHASAHWERDGHRGLRNPLQCIGSVSRLRPLRRLGAARLHPAQPRARKAREGDALVGRPVAAFVQQAEYVVGHRDQVRVCRRSLVNDAR